MDLARLQNTSSIQKISLFLSTSNEQLEIQILKNIIYFIINNIKHLGVNLTKYVQDCKLQTLLREI